MGKIPDLAAIRDWCKSMFQPKGEYANKSDIEKNNLTKGPYVTGNIDVQINNIATMMQHPNGIWGHSKSLEGILGFWTNVFMVRTSSFLEASEIAIGTKGMAVRYHDHEQNEWGEWRSFNVDLLEKITQINNNLSIVDFNTIFKGENDFYPAGGAVTTIKNCIIMSFRVGGQEIATQKNAKFLIGTINIHPPKTAYGFCTITKFYQVFGAGEIIIDPDGKMYLITNETLQYPALDGFISFYL